MRLGSILKLIERYFPAGTAMEKDRIGLQVQSGNEEVRKILISLELDDHVIEEANQKNCDCIISFHPLIFFPITELHDTERVGRLVQKLIKNNISLISIHTNFDSYINGTSNILANKLGLKVNGFLVPDKDYDNYGMGVIAEPVKSLSPDQLLENVQSVCTSPLRYNLGATSEINKIAIVGGSGTSFIGDALKSGADCFITADVTYHRFHEVNGKMMLIDPGHYEMEQFVPMGLLEFFREHIGKNEYDFIQTSKSLTNPIKYYPSGKYEEEQKKYLINNFMVV
jgi:dinuclear metal center YbgI/SA1388 family protein